MSLKEAKLGSLADKLYGPPVQGEGSKSKKKIEKKVEKKLFSKKKK